jgi:hypothetical protein
MKTADGLKVSNIAQWLFPSLKDILFLAYLFVPILVNASGVLYDGDTGWHIRNGEQILQSRSFPRSDYFSYTNYGREWFAWEWLADVLLAIIHRYAGLNGIVVWANLTFALTFGTLFRWMIRRGGNVLVCLAWAAVAGFASAVHWLARPHLFTMLLVLAWYILLEKAQGHGMTFSRLPGRMFLIAPSIMLLWTNLHGGFVAGIILLLIYAFGNYLTSLTSSQSEKRTTCRRIALHFAWLALMCGVVTSINPYGILVHKHIFDSYLQSQSLVDKITEFASPNFHTLVIKFFELLVLSSLLVAGISYRRLSFIEIGLILFWTHMALFSVRHVPLYSVIIVPIIVDHLTNYLSSLEADKNVQRWAVNVVTRFNRYSANILKFELQFPGYLYPCLFSTMMIVISLNQGYLGKSRVLNFGFDAKQFPVGASSFIESHSLEGNLLTTDYWGGYIIYRFHPQRKVFFDGRSDMYSREFIREYESLMNLEYSWKTVLQKYDIAWILLPVNYGLASALKELPDWKIIYDDQFAIIFVKRAS